MKHLATLLLLCGICIFATAQNYPVGHRSINFKDAARTGGYAISGGTTFPTGGTGRDIGTEVYYPATSAGDNTPFATGVFPLVVFGHGFAMTWDSYKSFTDSLVRNGYIVALPRTEGSLTGPSHLDFGKDLAKVVELMQQANTTAGSPFLNRLTNRAAIGGHSMGGGATFLADAFAPSEVVCYFTFAAAETNPSAVAAAANITRPHLTISGSYDCVAPPASHQNLIYNALASTCKTKIELIKGYHCAFADNSFTCGFGEGTCITSGGLTVANQLLLTRRYLNPYLDYYLKGICPAWTKFEDLLDSTTTATIQQSCNNIVPSNATIIGDTVFCFGTSTTLTASPSGFNYMWSDNTTGVSILVNTAGTQTLSVGNGSCTLPSVSINTTVKPYPSGIQVTTSADTICLGDTIQVSVSANNATSYQWTIPPSWQIVSGTDSSTIAVVATTNATISVRGGNDCGNSSVARTDTIRFWPAMPEISSFIGDYWDCVGNAFLTSVDSINNAEAYVWTYNGISDTTTEPQYTIESLPLGTTVLVVSAINKCSQLYLGGINIGGLDIDLTVVQHGDTVIASANFFQSVFTWYKDGIEVGTGPYFFPTSSGLYTVKSQCNSSADINFIRTSINNISAVDYNIYPNPITRGNMLQLPSNKQVKVYNNLGALVYEAEHAPQINTAAFAAGIYVIWLDGNATKLVIE